MVDGNQCRGDFCAEPGGSMTDSRMSWLRVTRFRKRRSPSQTLNQSLCNWVYDHNLLAGMGFCKKRVSLCLLPVKEPEAPFHPVMHSLGEKKIEAASLRRESSTSADFFKSWLDVLWFFFFRISYISAYSYVSHLPTSPIVGVL